MVPHEAKAELERIAQVIYDDLGLPKDGHRPTFKQLVRLCREKGADVAFEALPRQKGGFIAGDDIQSDFLEIVLSVELSEEEACSVLVHELAHKLIWTDKYAHFNDVTAPFVYRDAFDAHEWGEHMARTVERLFLERTGLGFRTLGALRDTFPRAAAA